MAASPMEVGLSYSSDSVSLLPFMEKDVLQQRFFHMYPRALIAGCIYTWANVGVEPFCKSKFAPSTVISNIFSLESPAG